MIYNCCHCCNGPNVLGKLWTVCNGNLITFIKLCRRLYTEVLCPNSVHDSTVIFYNTIACICQICGTLSSRIIQLKNGVLWIPYFVIIRHTDVTKICICIANNSTVAPRNGNSFCDCLIYAQTTPTNAVFCTFKIETNCRLKYNIAQSEALTESTV